MVELTLTTRRPAEPMADADFAFYVDFKKGEGPASRVFAASHEFIRACEQLDRELVTSIDASIETVMVLEDVESRSLKVWLRNTLRAVDDQALKDIDWRPLVGGYLVQAKYIILRWMDGNEAPRSLSELGREIQKTATENDVRHIPDYAPVSPSALIDAIRGFERVKGHLVEGDEASMFMPDGNNIDFNLSTRLDVDEIEDMATKEVKVHSVSPIVMVVRKPDYLGTSMWDLRHDKRALSVKIEDDKWLREFQNRRVDVRPGHALRCAIRIETMYDYDNKPINKKYYVEKVMEVVENQYEQGILLLRGES